MKNLNWHGQDPCVYIDTSDWPQSFPWRPNGSSRPNPLAFAHRTLFMPNFVKACEEWITGTALIKEGAKALMVIPK